MHGNIPARDVEIFALVCLGHGDATQKTTYESFDPLPVVGEIFQIDIDALDMATFVPYKYVPTASRPQGAKTRRRPTPEQSSILNDHAPAKQMGVALEALLPAVGVASNSDGSRIPGYQVETSIAYFDNFGDYEDCYLPTIEELLHTNLQKADSGVEEAGKEHIRGAAEECLEDARSIDQNTSALSVSSRGEQGNPIELQDDELRASEDEIDWGNVNGDQEILNRTETVLNPIRTPTSDPDQESSILDSMRPLSEPLHDRINTEDPFTACSESETTKALSVRHRSRSPRRPRSLQHGQLIQEDRAYRRQATPGFANTTSGEMLPQQQDEEENINSYDDGLQQSHKDTARVAPITELGDELPLPSPSLEPSQEQATSNSDHCSDDEPSTGEAESDDSDRRQYPTKRKRSPLPYVGLTQRKRRQHLQPGFTQEGRNCSPQRWRWKPHNHGSRVVPACGSNSQLPSPPSSSLGCSILSESSKHSLPLLTEVTFRLRSPNYYSFSAFFQDDSDEPQFSFAQLSKLIEGVGHSGNIEDLTIKPLKQHSFLVTGFSRLTAYCPSESRKLITNAYHIPLGARRTRLDKCDSANNFPYQRRETSTCIVDSGSGDSSSEDELCRPDTRKYSQWSASRSSDVDDFGDCDLNTGSDGDAYSSEDSVGRSDDRKYSEWSPLDKQRLSAYKKEGKPWEWIFSKFPGRTKGAVRTRWSTMQPKVK